MSVEIVNSGRLFNLQEAQQLLPLINKVTQMHAVALEPLQYRLDRMLSNDPRRAVIERDFESEVSAWRGKIHRLGARAASLWVVEFDVGEGLLNWKYPELEIACFRLKDDTIRRRLKDYVDETDPDWAL